MFVGRVQGRYSEVGYLLREMSKANRPGKSSFSGIWRFFFLNSWIWQFSYLVSTLCPTYHFFVFCFLSFPFPSSGVLFLWLRPLHYNIPPILSQNRLTFFPNNANNSSTNFVMLLQPKWCRYHHGISLNKT